MRTKFMKIAKLASLMACSLSSVGALAAAPSQEYPICSPAEQTVRLKAGEKVRLPLCFLSRNMLAVDGIADLAKTDELISKHGMHPIEVAPGKALVRISVIDYAKTTLGSYREVVLGVLAARDPNFVPGPNSDPARFGFYFMKLWVDSDVALRSGTEIWGINKERATISVRSRGVDGIGFTLVQEGKTILSAHWNTLPTESNPAGLDGIASLFSSGSSLVEPTRSIGTVKGGVKKQAVAPTDLMINPNTYWGGLLAKIQFFPTGMLTSDDYAGQLSAPVQE